MKLYLVFDGGYASIVAAEGDRSRWCLGPGSITSVLGRTPSDVPFNMTC